MSNSIERRSPMSSQLVSGVIEENQRFRRGQREKVNTAKQSTQNKEVFDIARFGEFYSTRGDNGEILATPEVIEEYEAEYYLTYPEINSLREYAERRNELDRQSTN